MDRPGTDPARALRTRMLVVGAAALVAGVAAVLVLNDGALTYAGDDAYIHLAIARNLVEHGTWGLVPGTFESASSAPLWTLLVAIGTVVLPVPDPWVPLVLDVAAGALVVHLLVRWVAPDLPAPAPVRAGLAALPVTVGLVPLVLTGMEHVLETAVLLGVLLLLRTHLTDDDPAGARRSVHRLAALLSIAALLRPSTAFIGVAAAAVLLLMARSRPEPEQRSARTRGALLVGVAPASALLISATNLAMGQHWMPNSIAAKSAATSGSLVDPSRLSDNLSADPPFTLVLVACAVLAVRGWRRGGDAADWAPAAVVAVTGALHVTFAAVGVLWRYEAYLFVAGVAVIVRAALPLATGERTRLVGTALLLAAAVRLPVLLLAPPAAHGIYAQQWQMGEVLAEVAEGEGVVVNDIGAVAWLHDGPLLDLAGLGSYEVLVAAEEGRLDRELVTELAERDRARVAVVFTEWFAGVLPEGWLPVERWCLTRGSVTNAAPCVTWFAAPADVDRLAAALDDHRPDLPASVQVGPPG